MRSASTNHAFRFFGWLFIIIACAHSFLFALFIPVSHGIKDFGASQARATHYFLLTIPPIILFSAIFLYASRFVEKAYMRRIYWALVFLVVIIWGYAFYDLFYHLMRGWYIFRGLSNH